MASRFNGYPDQPPADAAAQQSRFAGMVDVAKRMAVWTAPVVGDALKQGAGVDVYDFAGAEQPRLSEDQRFGSGVAQFAMRKAAERLATR
jgi:hypothetical protein